MVNNSESTNHTETYTYRYPRPAVTADVVLITYHEDQLQVLLVQRKHEPFAGSWALPGGFIEMDEDLRTAALRELEEETGVSATKSWYVKQLHAYGAPDRDPRYRTISVAYLALASSEMLEKQVIRAASDAEEVEWWNLTDLPELSFDHSQIVSDAARMLRREACNLAHVFRLLPEEFTLTELQNVYEAISDEVVKKRNFRRKMLHDDRLEDVGRMRASGHRPSKLYRVRKDAAS